ncbi:MAG: CidA/LrgA family protein [Cyanobacteria bacterium P01_D01_bin.123]
MPYELLGEVSAIALHLPIPDPVLSMTYLFATLWVRLQPVPNFLDLTSTVLLSRLPLLFIPTGIGVIVHFERIAA